jgi:hypothetical protein
MWEYVRNVKDEQGDLKKVRTKVKMQQLRSRNQKEPAELKADRLIFQDKIYKQCEEILDDLFPRNSLEHKLSALDLINIVDTDEPTPDENHAIEILATSLFQGSEVTLSNGRKIQFRPLYGDIEEARIEWIREGRDTVKEIAKKMMSLPDYDDSKSVVKKQMKEAAIMNENELDEIKWKYENSRSIVGISDEEFKEMYEEMATHAKKLNKVEEKKFEDEMEKFVHQGNITLDFDPSDIEDDADANENIEEEADAIDDVMGDDDLELLQKFYLTSAEMQDDEKISGRKKRRISQADIWATIMKELRISTPSLAKVIELMLVIPSSTAEVERFFKVLKEMKSKKRNRLSAKKLRKMFMIFHFLDLENYDKERVFEIFQQKLSR